MLENLLKIVRDFTLKVFSLKHAENYYTNTIFKITYKTHAKVFKISQFPLNLAEKLGKFLCVDVSSVAIENIFFFNFSLDQIFF